MTAQELLLTLKLRAELALIEIDGTLRDIDYGLDKAKRVSGELDNAQARMARIDEAHRRFVE